eukprot:gene4482-3275_t
MMSEERFLLFQKSRINQLNFIPLRLKRRCAADLIEGSRMPCPVAPQPTPPSRRRGVSGAVTKAVMNLIWSVFQIFRDALFNISSELIATPCNFPCVIISLSLPHKKLSVGTSTNLLLAAYLATSRPPTAFLKDTNTKMTTRSGTGEQPLEMMSEERFLLFQKSRINQLNFIPLRLKPHPAVATSRAVMNLIWSVFQIFRDALFNISSELIATPCNFPCVIISLSPPTRSCRLVQAQTYYLLPISQLRELNNLTSLPPTAFLKDTNTKMTTRSGTGEQPLEMMSEERFLLFQKSRINQLNFIPLRLKRRCAADLIEGSRMPCPVAPQPTPTSRAVMNLIWSVFQIFRDALFNISSELIATPCNFPCVIISLSPPRSCRLVQAQTYYLLPISQLRELNNLTSLRHWRATLEMMSEERFLLFQKSRINQLNFIPLRLKRRCAADLIEGSRMPCPVAPQPTPPSRRRGVSGAVTKAVMNLIWSVFQIFRDALFNISSELIATPCNFPCVIISLSLPTRSCRLVQAQTYYLLPISQLRELNNLTSLPPTAFLKDTNTKMTTRSGTGEQPLEMMSEERFLLFQKSRINQLNFIPLRLKRRCAADLIEGSRMPCPVAPQPTPTSRRRGVTVMNLIWSVFQIFRDALFNISSELIATPCNFPCVIISLSLAPHKKLSVGTSTNLLLAAYLATSRD